MTPYYYHLTTEGEDTNLQLYSFRQAKCYWNELKRDYAQDGDSTEDIKERCVFVLATLGLSISQLLGQNPVAPSNQVGYPKPLFDAFVDTHDLDPKLKNEFEEFNDAYNGIRHFGKTTSPKGHQRVNTLTFQATAQFYQFGLKVWRTVICVYNDEGDLNEFLDEELGCCE